MLSEQQRRGFSSEVAYGDATKRLRFPSHTVDYVYSAHMIEHMSREQGLSFLREAKRILKPSGIIRLATPDLASLVAAYTSDKCVPGDARSGDRFMESLGMYHRLEQRMVARLVSRNFSLHWHQWLYDEGSLSALLADAGFLGHRVSFREGHFPDLELIEVRPESLFVQASVA